MRMNYLFQTMVIGVIFLCFDSILRAEVAETHKPMASGRRVDDNRSTLTADHNFFQYNDRRIGVTAQNIDTAVRDMERLTPLVDKFLSNNNYLEAGLCYHLSAWGGLYSNLPLLTGRPDVVDTSAPPYILSLMFCSKFKEAENAAKAILEKKPDHYGALLLLGLLSIWNRDNFPCLEKAFEMNPYKTIWIFDWHLKTFSIKPQKEWDFAHAYFMMLAKHREILQKTPLPPLIAASLLQSLHDKYDNPEYPFLSGEEIKPQMQILKSILQKSLQKENMQRHNHFPQEN